MGECSTFKKNNAYSCDWSIVKEDQLQFISEF